MRRLFLSCVLAAVAAGPALADVIVLDNRSTRAITVRISPVTSLPFMLTIPSGDVTPVFVDGKAYISFPTRRERKRYLMSANSAYYFGNVAGGDVDLQKIGLGGDRASAEGRPMPGNPEATTSATIPVKILVDEEEPTHQRVWEQRLRKRIEQASAILDKHCRLRLQVVAINRWNSDNNISDFFESLAEFEDEVDPFPGRLAIGFTSQYEVTRGRVHLGGTRGLFHSHILIREWSRHIGEPERLELLVHELGHYLGAMHSPEPSSVMRPVLGDRLAIRTNFRIRFDPVNTLAMAMIVEEMRRRNVRDPRQLSAGTTRRLAQIFGSLTGETAGTGRPRERRLGNPNRPSLEPQASPMVAAVRDLLNEIVRGARENYELPDSGSVSAGQPARRQGDALTEYYVRRTAAEAQTLPADAAPLALVSALGIGLDDSPLLRELAGTKQLVMLIEPAGRRSVRLAFLGKPTVRERRDLAQHFFVAAFLTAVEGKKAADAAALGKELVDSRRTGSGFSFADLAVSKAGALFAAAVLNKRISLDQLATGFSIDDYVPPIDGLAEGLAAEELLTRFGDQHDGRFQQQLRKIDQLLAALPAYQHLDATPAADDDDSL